MTVLTEEKNTVIYEMTNEAVQKAITTREPKLIANAISACETSLERRKIQLNVEKLDLACDPACEELEGYLAELRKHHQVAVAS